MDRNISDEWALEGSPPRSRKLFTKEFWSRFMFELSDPRGSGGRDNMNRNRNKNRKRKPKESKSSTDGLKTDKVSSEGTGAKKVFKPKDLQIRWQEDSQYWSIPEGDGPAELLKVCWLDVSGEMPVTKGKTYEVSFMLSMNTQNSFGWDDPVTVMARIGKEGKYESKKLDLSKLSGEEKEFSLDHKCRVEFESDKKSGSNETLYFGLYETWTNKWKGGLRIHEAIVQEIPAGNNIASTSNTHSEERKEIAA